MAMLRNKAPGALQHHYHSERLQLQLDSSSTLKPWAVPQAAQEALHT